MNSTEIGLMPGNKGIDCLRDGKHYDNDGNLIECCCDECDYLMCCISDVDECNNCNVPFCPRVLAERE